LLAINQLKTTLLIMAVMLSANLVFVKLIIAEKF